MTAVRAVACFSQSTALRTSIIMQLTSDVLRLHRPSHARRWFRPAILPDCGISCSTGVRSRTEFALGLYGVTALDRSVTTLCPLRFRPTSCHILRSRFEVRTALSAVAQMVPSSKPDREHILISHHDCALRLVAGLQHRLKLERL